MRIMIKGGVWKNTEDEILKAAVMKYGMNSWDRVASLLSRKSAKQCKARWYEWLDPSIKKTEWSREEEEKLLHLAKLMPSQWRTIAPMVGRTAGQCMEHYERLLDAAQSEQQGESGEAGADDPRRLRPGEIDPNPETKPARPDPVDMDEDEKEMLSEARARLANTKGKKAKRKAREKQLEEAKRLASLQKKRELKAAGINSSSGPHPNKRRKFIDYANEIPFQKDAPAGFYDVRDEEEQSAAAKLSVKDAAQQLNRVENQRRDAQEKKLRQQDEKRQKSMMKSNLPEALSKVNERNDPLQDVKRTSLELPAPVVSEQELSDLAKLGMGPEQAAALAQDADGAGDRMLTDGRTPLRTPSTAARGKASQRSMQDAIRQEAANLAASARETTPLLGGDNVELQEGTGYEGVTPSRTPVTRASNVEKTPLSSTRTPLRDELGINTGNEESTALVDKKQEKIRVKRQRSELEKAFDDLPEPQYDYGVQVPEKEEEEEQEVQLEEDAADREARMERQKELERLKAFKRQSQAIQKELPRPSKVQKELVDGGLSVVSDEMYKLIEYDIAKHPMETGKKSKKRKKSKAAPSLEAFDDDAMEKARNMVRLEASLHSDGDMWSSLDKEAMNNTWSSLQSKQLCRAEGEDLQFAFADNSTDRIRAMKAEFDELKQTQETLKKRVKKFSSKIQILHGGYSKRAEQSHSSLNTMAVQLQDALIERSCFASLSEMEAKALQSRISQLASDVNIQQAVEAKLQKDYAALVDRK